MTSLTEKDGKLLLTVKVLPKSSRNSIILEDQFIKIKITSAPVDGKANKTLIDYLSRVLKISKSSIEIVSGESGRTKVLSISGITLPEFENKLNLISERS